MRLHAPEGILFQKLDKCINTMKICCVHPFEFIQSFFNSHRLGVSGCAIHSNPALRADAEGIHTGKITALVTW